VAQQRKAMKKAWAAKVPAAAAKVPAWAAKSAGSEGDKHRIGHSTDRARATSAAGFAWNRFSGYPPAHALHHGH